MTFKDIFNKFKYAKQGIDTTNYEKERIQDLLQKGYSSEQVQDMVNKEVFARYGISTIGKTIADPVCMDLGIAAGGTVGSAVPGIGTAGGAIAGGAALRYGCNNAIDYVTDYGVKKVSEKMVRPENVQKQPDLRTREMYYESMDPHIEKQSPKYFLENAKDSKFPEIKQDPNGTFNLKIEKTAPTSKYQGYKNPLTNDNRIFTREDIGSFSTDEYSDAEPAIMAQWGKIGIPTNGDLERERLNNNATCFVQGFTRRDGTKVKSHFRAI